MKFPLQSENTHLYLATCPSTFHLYLQALDNWYYRLYSKATKVSRRKPNTSIRINPEAIHQARIAAVSQRKTLGQWLEEAITEKIEKRQEK